MSEVKQRTIAIAAVDHETNPQDLVLVYDDSDRTAPWKLPGGWIQDSVTVQIGACDKLRDELGLEVAWSRFVPLRKPFPMGKGGLILMHPLWIVLSDDELRRLPGKGPAGHELARFTFDDARRTLSRSQRGYLQKLPGWEAEPPRSGKLYAPPGTA